MYLETSYIDVPLNVIHRCTLNHEPGSTNRSHPGLQDMGVCPDSGYAKDAAANSATLLSGSRQSGVTSVTFSRPLGGATDKWDHPWQAEEGGATAAPAVFAMGPLSERSTATQPVVLYHGKDR
jgi:hypothetical protein